MSDIQPRKRKEKRRKKEDSVGSETESSPHPGHYKGAGDDYNIHLYHDAHTGGGWCAKIVFFALLGVIGVLIGFIIIEHRGATDLDAPVQDSKYAEIFEGWVDDMPNLHDEEDHHALDEHDEDEAHSQEEEAAEGHSEEHDDEEHEDVSQPEDMQSDQADEDKPVSNETEEDEDEGELEQTEKESATNEEENEDDEDDDDENEEEVDSSELTRSDAPEEIEEQSEETLQDDENEDEESEEDDEQTESNENVSVEQIQKVLDSLEEDEPLEEITESDEQSEENEVVDNNPKEAEILEEEEKAAAEAEAEEETTGGVKSVKSTKTEESDSEKEDAKVPASKSGGPKSFGADDDILDDEYYFKEHTNAYNKLELSIQKYMDEIRTKNSKSFKILYGLAVALDRLAEQLRSNQKLTEAIEAYENFLNRAENIPDNLFRKAALRSIDRMRFKGEYSRAANIQKMLIKKFPDEVDYYNQLAVTHLMSDRVLPAKYVLEEVLKKWPNNGFAKVHYGFILKTHDNDLKTSIEYLKSGIETNEPGVLDGRFFFHLGDALTRLGKNDEAVKIYEKGVKEGFFLSKYQRSLYNLNRLTARPIWSLEQTTYKQHFNILKNNWKRIRDEGLNLLNSLGTFKDEAENLRDVGDWKQFEMYSRGRKISNNCNKVPFTCSLIDNFTAASKCRRGQVKFSVMHPGTHVWPHCGPTNCRLRAHLGLKIPSKTYIRVADVTKTWKEGEFFVFDDSFEHEVWHNGTGVRLILIVDVWHPEVTAYERQTLPAI